MDGSETNKATSAGVYRWGLSRGHSFSVGLLTTVFQAKIYAIKACIMENIQKSYTAQWARERQNLAKIVFQAWRRFF
jgi:hypothetical protein